MPCRPDILKNVPLFALLDNDELAVLSAQVEERSFAARERIYKIGDPSGAAYIVISGIVVVSTIDQDHQDVIVDEPGAGEFFGFASMIEQTPHQTTAVAKTETLCVEVDRHDLTVLLRSKPMAGMDLLTVLGRQIHAAQHLVRTRVMRNPNEVIEEKMTVGERIADAVAKFGGSWTFIITFSVAIAAYTAVNVQLRNKAWDPYPFILLNLFLSMLAAIQAPVIMMSQNRQDQRDRLRSELDYDVNRRAEAEIQLLSRKLYNFQEKLDDIQEVLKKK